MKATVIGASGFVGQNLVEALANTDWEITAADLTERKFPKGVRFVKANILNFESIYDALEGADVVVHLAASNLTTSLRNPRFNVEGNIGGTMSILEAIRKHDIRKIIFSSASSVYGIPQYIPVDEKHPYRPTTVYGVCKYSCEHFLRVYHELYDIDYFIFRFTNVYGPKQYTASRGLIPNVLKKLINKEPITIYGDGSQTRDFVYAGDIAEFVFRALEDDVKNDTVNLGSGKDTSIMDIVKISSEFVGTEPKIDFKPQESGERKNFTADLTKLKQLFGKTPQTEIREGLKKTYEWFSVEGN